MQRNLKISYWGMGIILFASLFACHMERIREAQDIDVTARQLFWNRNGSPMS